MTNTILKVVVGSRMWGTNTPESDTDYKEVVMSPLRDVLDPFKNHGKGIQKIESGDDSAVYELMHMMRLIEKGNPTMLEVLFSPHVIVSTSPGIELRKNRALLLDSQNIINATLGMSKAQLSRAERYTKKNPDDVRIGKLYASTLLSLDLSYDVLASFGTMRDIQPSPMRSELIALKQGDTNLYDSAQALIQDREDRLRRFEEKGMGFSAHKNFMANFCYSWYRRLDS